MKLSTAEDGQVDFKDQSLPSVTWEGIEYSNSGWSKEWDTEFDVPKVRHQVRAPGATRLIALECLERATQRFIVGGCFRHSLRQFTES